MTARQETIRQALAEAGTFLSAQDVHARLWSAGHRIGIATVYRSLHALAASGDVDVLAAGDGPGAYRACASKEHHHHLLCRACGQTVEVTDPALECLAAAIGREHGFTGVTHIAEFFGTCPRCGAAPPGSREGAPG